MNKDGITYTLLAASVFTIFIGGPTISVGPLDLRAFDAVFMILIIYFPIWIVSTQNIEIQVPRHYSLWSATSTYLLLSIFLPILGFITYDYPVSYIVGDLRWVQVSVVAIVFILFFKQLNDAIMFLKFVFKYIILTNLFFVVIQYFHWASIFDTSFILNLWYNNGASLGQYGYHIGRFAGAQSSSSSLGLVSVSATAIYLASFINNQKKSFIIILAVVLLIASGHRTSIIALCLIFIITAGKTLISRNIQIPSAGKLLKVNFLFVMIFYVLYYFNIGRFRTSDRYRELIDILFSGQLIKISGRDGRWQPVLYEAEQYTIGTLSNPSWVLNHLPAIDSYFVLIYIQGGHLFLFSYIILLLVFIYYSQKILQYNEYALIPLYITIIIFGHSIMQNSMTSISTKFLLVLNIVIIYLLLNEISLYKNSDNFIRST